LNIDQIGLWLGFIFTLMVFSYLLGDNFLYRLAVYVFVGLAAGYVTMVTLESVVLPWVRAAFNASDPAAIGIGLIPILLGLLLLLKTTKRYHRLGNLGLAYLIGIGAAIALVGAISGTLIPLVAGTADAVLEDAVNGFLIVLGVICTLIYFQYLARRGPGGVVQRGLMARTFGTVGQGFMAITLGVLYGGAILTGLTIFSERIAFILARLGGG
jgi:hypothetical protein